jgi:hypothetical protein
MTALPVQDGSFLARIGGLFGGGLGNASLTPEQQLAQQQRAALFQAGLATLASAQQPGASFGGSLFSGFQAGAGALQQAQQNAFQSKRLKQQEEREERLANQEAERLKLAQAERDLKDRERTQDYARRISIGLGNAKGQELGYLKVVGRTPEFQAVARQYGFDPNEITTPEQAQALAQQLGSLGALGADPLKAPQTPAEIQEFQYYQSLSPQDKATYLQVKRNSQPFTMVDFAGGQRLLNKVTGELGPGTTAEEEGQGRGVRAAGEASGKTLGEARATAQLDLPRVENNANQAILAIRELKQSPGLPGIFGVQGRFPNFPGSAASDAQARLEQIQGKTFLEAFNTLKGGGAITETEGAKATNAIARLQKAQSVEAAVQALTELEEVIATGVEVARRKASGTKSRPAQRDVTTMSDEELLRAINE